MRWRRERTPSNWTTVDHNPRSAAAATAVNRCFTRVESWRCGEGGRFQGPHPSVVMPAWPPAATIAEDVFRSALTVRHRPSHNSGRRRARPGEAGTTRRGCRRTRRTPIGAEQADVANVVGTPSARVSRAGSRPTRASTAALRAARRPQAGAPAGPTVAWGRRGR